MSKPGYVWNGTEWVPLLATTLSVVDWSNVANTPTTLTGYGISNASITGTLSVTGDTTISGTTGLGVGRSPVSSLDNTTGASIQSNGQTFFTASGVAPLLVNRTTNDGVLLRFYRGSSTNVGDVSVTSGTITYGTFAGSHWSQINSSEDILVGTVMDTIDEMCVWEEEDLPNKTLAKVEISKVPASKRVYGVFLGVDEDDEHGDIRVGSLGTLFVRIAPGISVEGGDLLESDGNGCAIPQTDDIIRSSTIGKVTSSTVIDTYEDGSYLVPAVLYCG